MFSMYTQYSSSFNVLLIIKSLYVIVITQARVLCLIYTHDARVHMIKICQLIKSEHLSIEDVFPMIVWEFNHNYCQLVVYEFYDNLNLIMM